MRASGLALAFSVLFGATALIPPMAIASAPQRQAATTAKPAKAPATARPKATTQRSRAKAAPARPGGRAAARPARATPAVYGRLSCVPYVRMVTGMQIRGDARHWWHQANGLYARGGRPQVGAVMAFRASGSMRRGHVAVVSRVLGPRHVLIDHSNWAGPGIRRGTVMRNVHVIDASARNDWSSVQVQVGHDPSKFGRTYPLYGFIYNRPDTPTYFAGVPGGGIAAGTALEEVAEAPAAARATHAPGGNPGVSPRP